MTVSNIPSKFIARLRDENPLTQKEIEQAIEYADISGLHYSQIIKLAGIVIRKEFDQKAQIDLLQRYYSQSEGPEVVVSALSILPKKWKKKIREIGIKTLEKLIHNAGEINRSRLVIRNGLDCEMASIIPHCLKGKNDPGTKRILDAFTNNRENNLMSKFRKTAAAIAEIDPVPYLDAASPDPDGSTGFGFGHTPYSFYPLSKISANTLTDWCLKNESRWKRVVPYLEIFILDRDRDKENNTKEKLSPRINEILEISSQPGIVVRNIIEYVSNEYDMGPVIGDDSFKNAQKRRFEILKELKDHPREEVRNVISNSKILYER